MLFNNNISYFYKRIKIKKQTIMAENNINNFNGYIVPTIEIMNSQIFIGGKETIDPTLIGYALLDFAENQDNDSFKIVFKEQDIFVERLKSDV